MSAFCADIVGGIRRALGIGSGIIRSAGSHRMSDYGYRLNPDTDR
jgi:hypothetical protein